MNKEVLSGVRNYALGALIGLFITMAFNSHGNHNTSLPFAIFFYLALPHIWPDNRRGRLPDLTAGLLLMCIVSLTTLLAYAWWPLRVNWYDGPMGFGIGLIVIVPLHFLICRFKTANTGDGTQEN